MINKFSGIWARVIWARVVRVVAVRLAIPLAIHLTIFGLFLFGTSFLQFSGVNFVSSFVSSSISSSISSSWAQDSTKYPLHQAVRLDDFDGARSLLAAGKKHLALEPDDQGMLPLHIAVSAGNIEMVRLLVDEYGVDPDHIADSEFSSQSRGRSPLHLSAAEGDLGIVKFLLSSGADIFAVDIGGVTALHLAIQYGHSGIADELIKNMGKRVHVRDKNGTTPLHVAARHGQDTIISHLLLLGGEQASSSEGSHAVAAKKEVDAFASMDHSKHSPSEHLAVLRKHFEKMLNWNKDTDKEADLSSGNFVDAKNNFGLTPLHYAAAWGHDGAVKLLLSDGADVNVVNRQGLTPLFLASRDGRDDVVTLLSSQQDINLEKGDEEAHTPLCISVANGHLKIFARLLSRGADPHAKDKNGMIPLHIASKRGNFEAVTSLLKTEGGDINERDNIGNTPLHYAAGIGHQDLVESLLQSGADISVRNSNNETASDLARASGHDKILQVLR